MCTTHSHICRPHLHMCRPHLHMCRPLWHTSALNLAAYRYTSHGILIYVGLFCTCVGLFGIPARWISLPTATHARVFYTCRSLLLMCSLILLTMGLSGICAVLIYTCVGLFGTYVGLFCTLVGLFCTYCEVSRPLVLHMQLYALHE